MGFAECDVDMESRAGSVTSGLGSSPGRRGRSFNSSSFCPRSSTKLTQSIIRDHMVSHYKKVYSAKAAIDTSVPKSLTHSVKYTDQQRQNYSRVSRPPSAQSLSAQSRLSLQYDHDGYLCSRSSGVSRNSGVSRSSVVSSPSFLTKTLDYPDRNPDLARLAHPPSHLKSRSLDSALHRKPPQGARGGSGSFRDPLQKTYSGDLLQRHSQHFTPGRDFTPKTLKSEKRSFLEKYRYYRAPRRRDPPRTKPPECDEDPSQGFLSDPESEDELRATGLSTSTNIHTNRERAGLGPSPRFSTEADKSALMKKHHHTEEEELKYLEFVSAVTEDILSRRHISDRVIDRVMERHVTVNLHHLDEEKMRHLLVVLRKDFEEPTDASGSGSSALEKKKKKNLLLDSVLPHLDKKSDVSGDVSSYKSLIKSPQDARSGHSGSPPRTEVPTRTNRAEQESEEQVSEAIAEEDHLHRRSAGEEVSDKDCERTAAARDEGSTDGPPPAEEPSLTDGPSPADGPSSADEPSLSDGPSPAEESSPTNGPSPAEEPSLSDGPSPAEEPSLSDGPSPAEESSPTNGPSPAEEPSLTDGPSSSERPSPAAGLSRAEEPSPVLEDLGRRLSGSLHVSGDNAEAASERRASTAESASEDEF